MLSGSSNDRSTSHASRAAPSPAPSPSSAASSSGANGRPFTPEQESGAKRVLELAKKGHYEVLGVAKNASDDDIKKAYRKLALKFHPDKNSAPSAEGAFKAISTAMETLGDTRKRQVYDMYGTTEGVPDAPGGGGGGGFHGEEMSPEDLFNFFFHGIDPRHGRGGGFSAHHPNMRTFHFGAGGMRGAGGPFRSAPRQAPQNNSVFGQLLQILPILLLLFMSFGGSFMSSNSGDVRGNVPYSFHRAGRFQTERKTSLLGPDIHIPYFVTDRFDSTYGRTLADLKRVEKMVMQEHRDILGRQCHSERERKRNRIEQARWRYSSKQREDEMKQAQAMTTPSCDTYDSMYGSSGYSSRRF